MRVAFPTNNQKTIANHIGLAKEFLIVDTDTNERIYIKNPLLDRVKEVANLPEGHRGLGVGRIVPVLLREEGVDVFVARDFGEGMILNLQREGIKPIVTDEKEIDKFLENFDGRIGGIELERSYGFGRGFGRGYGRGYGFGRGYGRGFGRGYGRFCRRRWV
ncbi:MAG: NifB/NifX family molybdenum-iron cluster-binding protein [Nautiliaceae bacterium]